MSGGHTPGPWSACRDATCPCGAIWDATGNIHLATAFDETALGMDAFGSDIGVSRNERIANARLIAAAPDTFECTKLLESLCAWMLHRFGPDGPEGKEAGFRLSLARAALASADPA